MVSFQNTNELPFEEKYKPDSIDDICMHPRKVKDVKHILFEDMLENDKYRILLVAGPSGSCKSTLIKLLVRQYYRENSDRFRSFSISSVAIDADEHCFLEYDPLNKNESFKHFLQSCKMFKKNTNLMKFIIIKHLPNIYYEKEHAEFLRNIREWLDDDISDLLPPIVIIISECDIPKNVTDDISGGNMGFSKFDIKSHYIPETIFSNDILQHPLLKRVNVNKIAKLYLKRQLNKILANEIPKGESTKKYEYLVNRLSELGDLPSALIQLKQHFETPFLQPDYNTSKDTGLRIFHAMGKVIYGTKEENASNEDIIDKLYKDYQQYTDSVFKMSLLENIDIGCDKLEKFSDILDSFSETDTMEETLGTEVYLRKIRQSMDSNIERSKGRSGLKFTPFFKVYKHRQQCLKEYKDFQSLDGVVTGKFSCLKDIILESAFHDPAIKRHYYNKYKAWKEYRLSIGKSILNYAGIGSQLDPTVTYMNKLGGEYGSVASTTDIETHTDNKGYFESKYMLYLKKHRSAETGFELAETGIQDLPFDPLVDDFEIEESSAESDASDSSDDDSELFQLTSQKISSLSQKNVPGDSGVEKKEEMVSGASQDSDDSDEELFKLTSQHLQRLGDQKL